MALTKVVAARILAPHTPIYGYGSEYGGLSYAYAILTRGYFLHFSPIFVQVDQQQQQQQRFVKSALIVSKNDFE